MSWIIKISNNCFYKEHNLEEITFTNKVEFAKHYDVIGDALKAAIFIHEQLGYKIAKITSVSE